MVIEDFVTIKWKTEENIGMVASCYFASSSSPSPPPPPPPPWYSLS
jgi:hypothetical protein